MNPRIRVIKLDERKRQAKARVKEGRTSVRRVGQNKARDATATVTGWVDELREQKKQESADAVGGFNSLFEDPT
jgi:hypothetical protein